MDKRELYAQKKKLERLISEVEHELRVAPEGRLRIAQKRNQYYLVTEKGDTKGRYLSKKEITLAEALAQRDYNEKLLKRCQENLHILNLFLDLYDYEKIGQLYDGLNSSRRNLVTPKEISWESYAETWQKTPYLGKDMPEGVPYKYEHPLKLKNGRTIYPDFTILPIGQRGEVYLEHFGMMDDDAYRDSFFLKHSTMIQNGYVPGVNYIMTFESEKHPLNTKDLYTYLHNFLL